MQDSPNNPNPTVDWGFDNYIYNNNNSEVFYRNNKIPKSLLAPIVNKRKSFVGGEYNIFGGFRLRYKPDNKVSAIIK